MIHTHTFEENTLVVVGIVAKVAPTYSIQY
jgi:hypothetical protein